MVQAAFYPFKSSLHFIGPNIMPLLSKNYRQHRQSVAKSQKELAALIFTLPGLWFACLFALTAAMLASLALWQPMHDVYPHQPVAVQTVQSYANVQLLRERRTARKCSLHLTLLAAGQSIGVQCEDEGDPLCRCDAPQFAHDTMRLDVRQARLVLARGHIAVLDSADYALPGQPEIRTFRSADSQAAAQALYRRQFNAVTVSIAITAVLAVLWLGTGFALLWRLRKR